MSISITIDDTDVRKAFAGMSALVNNQRKMMDDVGGVVVMRVTRGFETTTSPYGKKWQKLAKLSKLMRLGVNRFDKKGNRKNFKKNGGLRKAGKREVRAGFQPLNDKGYLKKSITHEAYKNGVEIGTNKKYASTHQFGRKNTGKMFKGATIPARPFLPTNGLPKAWKDEVLDTMKQHMGKAIYG